MAAKALLVSAVVVVLVLGHAPRMRELRNPDAEGGGRSTLVLTRHEA